MYLKFDKLTLSFHSCFMMTFDSKLKINLYHEHFPDALEKFTRFSKNPVKLLKQFQKKIYAEAVVLWCSTRQMP